VYGKRQMHKLIPMIDTDMLAICKSIPVMLSDAAGAQMFQCFSILYGVNVNVENITMSPNAFWSFKSEDEKKPEIGSIKPEASTQEVMDFVTNIFILWLETKGVRTGSMGNVQGGNVASGISKIIDEMDAYEIKKKSMSWFKLDEEELWNEKLPAIHNYWIKTGMLNSKEAPKLITEKVEITIEFEAPKPMLSRTEELNNIKTELEMEIISKEMAIKLLHPDYTEDMVSEIMESNSGTAASLMKTEKEVKPELD
jgi:peroxiredoxin family protein